MSLSRIEPQVYETAHTTAVLTDHSALGVLKFTGKSRLDLINRMSTQAVLDLQSGAGAATILTTDIGRIIDRLLLYAASDSVYALTGENNADFIARYLMRFVFFNDDFQVEDLSGKTAVFGAYGPQAAAKLADAGFPETDLPLHHWRQTQIGDWTAYLHRTDPIAGDGYFVMCAAADRDALWPHLLNAGLTAAGADDYEFLRIESGIKRLGHELSQDYIPLEADLWNDVSFKKGCYIGQEIIARLESRNRLAKKLVKLSPAGPISEGETITAEGKTAGTVTSAAAGPNGIVALGYVKTAVLEANTPLMVGEVTCER